MWAQSCTVADVALHAHDQGTDSQILIVTALPERPGLAGLADTPGEAERPGDSTGDTERPGLAAAAVTAAKAEHRSQLHSHSCTGRTQVRPEPFIAEGARHGREHVCYSFQGLPNRAG